jgi:glycosyltransferase involved in cell wall biosynthesis
MKIAFLTTRTEKPSVRYRFLQYIPYIETRGWSVKVLVIPQGVWQRYKVFKSLVAFDMVFLQRKLFTVLDWYLLIRNAKKLVYDFDDAIMFRDSKRGNPESFLRMLKFKRTVEGSDVVIAGNEYLKGLAAPYNKNIVVIPTSIDMERYGPKEWADEDGTVTLGWIGSHSTIFYLERIKGVLDKIFEEYPNTRLKIVSDSFFDCNRMPVVKKKWNYDEETADLHSFDIGLMPLTDDPWSRGKCGFKLLQYMAAGVPAVASPVGVNGGIISHGVNGFLAGDEGAWLENVSGLIEDEGLRRRMGEKARKTVIERYSLEVNAPKILAVFGRLCADSDC